ncbi:MAG: tRNA (uridine(34)/cytosine(34)/5-carboxymethylaminomethyluridine(34)-2'-O)-methyltransferase TrmL [Cocleimonas sp.]
MFEIALYEPEIPPNTGNIMRLCANTGCQLHLIHPLGFNLDEKSLRRAGLDYRDMANVHEYDNFEAFGKAMINKTLYALTTKGEQNYAEVNFTLGDVLLFGPETRGLPPHVLDNMAANNKLRLPMLADSRSLNLSNTVAIVAYEALRQQGFKGLG